MGRASGESTTPELCVTTRNIWRAGSSSHGAALACLAHTHQDKQVWPRAFRCFPQLSKALQPDAVLVHARAGSQEGHLPAHPASPATLQAHGTQHAAHRVQQNRAPCVHTRLFTKLQTNPPWQAPPDRLQTLPQDSWAMRPRRSAAGANRHGGPLTRRKLSPLQNSMSASQQPLRSPVSRRVLPSIHLHVCSAATCSWHCTA